MTGILTLSLFSGAAAAQEGCEFADDGNDVYQSVTLGAGNVMTMVSNPHFLCEDDVQIWADSAVAYSADALSHLIGSVRYVDRTRELKSDEARYFSNTGRLQAQGHVFVINNEDGSVIENGDLVYLRRTDFRDEESLTVTTGADGLRPRANLQPADSDTTDVDDTAPTPYTVVGDRIVLEGSSYFNSTGDVAIERDSLFAFADSAEYEQASDRLFLEGSARVESSTYELVGRTVTIGGGEGRTTEVRAVREAVLTGVDLRLTAPQITLNITDGSVELLVAVPLPRDASAQGDSLDTARPVALAEHFELTADSLELTAPTDVVERIFAAGNARSVSRARDSLNVATLPDVAMTDWLEGDTIVVSFKSVSSDSTEAKGAPSDPEGGYEVERIVARVGARSLYRLLPADSTARAGTDPPAVHYVMGDEITIVMNEGEVEAMEVQGQTRGVHLEPLGAARAGSPPDSAAVPPDTLDTGPGAPRGDPRPPPPEPAGADPNPSVAPRRRP